MCTAAGEMPEVLFWIHDKVIANTVGNCETSRKRIQIECIGLCTMTKGIRRHWGAAGP